MAKLETINKVKELLDGHCYPPLKEAAQKWLDAAEDKASEVGEKIHESEFIAQLKDGIPTLDEVIALFGSEEGIKKFGEDTAAKIKAHAEEVKAAGEKFCDCQACTKAKDILKDLGEKLD